MTNQEIYQLYAKDEELFNTMAFRLTEDYDKVPDLCQDVLCKILTNKDKFKEGTNFTGWVQIIMRNMYINKYRRKKVEKTQLVSHDDVVMELNAGLDINGGIDNLQVEAILKLVEALPNKHSAVFNMFHLGYKYVEIADELNFPLGTVKNLMHIARAKLKEGLKDLYPEMMEQKRRLEVQRTGKELLCLETGQRFCNVAEAAEQLSLKPRAIYRNLRDELASVDGHVFTYVPC